MNWIYEPRDVIIVFKLYRNLMMYNPLDAYNSIRRKYESLKAQLMAHGFTLKDGVDYE